MKAEPTVVGRNPQRGGLTVYQVDIEKCSGCETCVEACPNEAISMVDGHAFIDQEECLECGICVDECPEEAIIEAD
jgi:Pyruvate/2-oxoacid:ferredoxin oxidoreductase delta subunit